MGNEDVQAPFLEDAFLQTSIPLNFDGHTKVGLNITSEAASFNAERFRIVFKPSAVFINVSANALEGNIEVKWTNANEIDIAKYDVEVSTDGNNFILLGTNNMLSNNQQAASYNLLHLSSAAGIYYYRIKSTSKHGAIVYSHTVSVKMINCKPSIMVYPNPISNNEINIMINDLPVGKYQYQLYNTLGQTILKGEINHQALFSTATIKPMFNLNKGNYQLIIADLEGKKNKPQGIG